MKHEDAGDDETTRSGLFIDQMRIVREMRERDARTGRTGVLIRPRYMVWENVEGAKTSPGGNHRGEDFAAVIEEIIRVAEPDADIHVCVPDGGWPNAGCYFAQDGTWSLAWRLVDAQFFGTPQRRRRIALLVDYGGLTAPEIMFDPQFERSSETGEPIKAVGDTDASRQEISAQSEGMQGNPQPGETTRESATAGTESGAGSTSYTLKIRGGVEIDSAGKRAGKGALLSGTLGVSQDQTLIRTGINGDVAGTLDASYYKGCGERQGIEREVVIETATPYGICSYESNAFKSSNPHSAIYKAETSRTLDNNGGNPACNQGGIAVVEHCFPLEGNGARPSHFGSGYGQDGDPSFTLNHVEQHAVATYDARGNGDGNVCCTLTGDHQDRVTDYTALVVENDTP